MPPKRKRASTCCVICQNPVDDDMFVSPCKGRHVFHTKCAYAWAKESLRNAIEIHDGVLTVRASCLPSCPLCREKISFTHRSTRDTVFYLASAAKSLLELGCVEHAPRVRFKPSSVEYATMLQTPILRDNMLRIGIQAYARNAASNAVALDALLWALNNEVASLSEQLKTFRAQQDGTKARANAALLTRTVKMLEAKHADYTLLLAAVKHAASSRPLAA